MTKKAQYNKEEIITAYKNGLSLPQLHREYGISISYAYQITKNAKINRTPSEAQLLSKSHQVEWHKLIRIGNRSDGRSMTRIISIPATLLIDLGFNPLDKLIGKWIINHDKIFLQIRKDAGLVDTPK